MLSFERDSQAPTKLAIKQVAQNWGESSIPYSEPGKYTAYDEMAIGFLHRVKAEVATNEAEGMPSQLVESGAAYSGFYVVGRYLYAGATHAAIEGFSKDELKSLLFLPDSFRSLQLLTREWNNSAVSMEYELGLNGAIYPRDKRIQMGFTLKEGVGLTIKDHPILSYRARASMVDRGDIDSHEAFARPAREDTIRCMAHSAGIVAYVYKYMLEVADKDPALFDETLAMAEVRQ